VAFSIKAQPSTESISFFTDPATNDMKAVFLLAAVAVAAVMAVPVEESRKYSCFFHILFSLCNNQFIHFYNYSIQLNAIKLQIFIYSC
jgi:hypothetical protein